MDKFSAGTDTTRLTDKCCDVLCIACKHVEEMINFVSVIDANLRATDTTNDRMINVLGRLVDRGVGRQGQGGRGVGHYWTVSGGNTSSL